MTHSFYSNDDADDMTVRVQYYDGRSMSATVPYRVTCTVVEAQAPMKGLSVNAQYATFLFTASAKKFCAHSMAFCLLSCKSFLFIWLAYL